MIRFLLKTVLIIAITLPLSEYMLQAQDNCYDCNIDSLTATIPLSKTDEDKIRILTLLVDLRMLYANTHYTDGFKLTDDISEGYINQLISLNNSHGVKDIDAYKNIKQAFDFFRNKEYLNGELSIKNAVSLFDKTHKKIPRLLFYARLPFDFAGNQKDRLIFYTEKLNYYLANGPVENVASCYHSLGGYYLDEADYNLAISYYLKSASLYKNFDNLIYSNELDVIAGVYVNWGNFVKATEYFGIAVPLNKIKKEVFV